MNLTLMNQAAPPTMSLARRFLLANLVVVVAASLAVAAWVGMQLENGVLERTAGVTALYIDSFVEPQIASLATSPTLSAGSVDSLDRLLKSTDLGERVVSFRIWTPDGTIVYSPNRALIGQRFEPEGGLARALAGEVSADMSDLSGLENSYERGRWDRLVETYVPVRTRGSATVIAVTEFYQLPDEIDAEVASARWASWAVVAVAALVSYLLLAGIVKQGSDTIERQQRALRERVVELSRLLEQNAGLHGRLRLAADRTTALNEAGLRRIGSDLHDGPAQTLALALLRLDELEGGDVVSDAVSSALGDLRLIASGLRSPAFDSMSLAEVAKRAVREHVRQTGTNVSLSVPNLTTDAPVVTKIGLYRVLQEALSNAARHAGGSAIEVELSLVDDGVRLDVRDRGPGFDAATVRPDALGLAGMRERAELLGGSWEITAREGGGTCIRLTLPMRDVVAA
ncbi:MAG TPA: sensor histidine kinase [Candidatus Limnocylindrales bacterium]|nr:sensor histidine kinase [Candidatus Limnocylindrales bacterium]